jgi:hypothetical protein
MSTAISPLIAAGSRFGRRAVGRAASTVTLANRQAAMGPFANSVPTGSLGRIPLPRSTSPVTPM